jgi:hypothetical protein
MIDRIGMGSSRTSSVASETGGSSHSHKLKPINMAMRRLDII